MNSQNNYFRISYYYYVKLRSLLNYSAPSQFCPDLNEVFDNIYIGNLATIFDTESLKSKNIKNVLSALTGCEGPYPENYNYLNLDLIDDEYENIIDKFDKSNLFIQKALDNDEKILVHCISGVSRSSTLVIAYLIDKFNKPPSEIIEMLRLKRPKINPNANFLNQLNIYYNIRNQKNDL